MLWDDDTPGPGAHDVESPAKYAAARGEPPAHTFGIKHARNKFISPAHQVLRRGEEGPGPGKYDSQHTEPGRTFSFAAADRSERAKFISPGHLKENFGLASPGPATHRVPSTLCGTPAQPFGTGTRPPLHAQPQFEAAPGSHEIDRDLGVNRHAQRNPPVFSFGKGLAPPKFKGLKPASSRPKTETDFARAELVGPSVSGKIHSPRYIFARSTRFGASKVCAMAWHRPSA